jgi:predicted dehydrogenase
MRMTRRKFLGATATATAAAAAAGPMVLRSPALAGEAAPVAGDRLNIAIIGAGRRMQPLLKTLTQGLSQNVVALCDVDSNQIDRTRKSIGEPLAKAKDYKDYRKLLESEKSVDAVVVATPDHWHARICQAAIEAGKHVYCEKPLTHTLAESRLIRELSRKAKVVTQTGNQGSAATPLRRAIEVIQAGALGQVREVHAWHPPHGWPCGVDRPAGQDAVPAGFDWDFWIGPAPMRPYKSDIYHPIAWRGWYDFGGGSVADFCCHAFNLPVRALQLTYPEKIEISGTDMGKESFPTSCKVVYSFPARGDLPPVKIFWYTGQIMPPEDVTNVMLPTWGKISGTGCLIVGEKGTISAGLWNDACTLKLKDEPKFRGIMDHQAVKDVAETIPRVAGHIDEWVDACKGKGKCFSDFDFGGRLTEIGLAGMVALRLNRDIEWDGLAMKVKGAPEADAIINPKCRADWH